MTKLGYFFFAIIGIAFFVLKGHSQTIMVPNPESGKNNFGIDLIYVDPLIKIFPETNIFPVNDAIADVARGEYATLQFILRSPFPLSGVSVKIDQVSGGFSLINRENTKYGYVDYVWVGKTIGNSPPDKLISLSGFFPDPIIDTSQINLRANYTQPIWISVFIPKDCPKGDFNGRLTITGLYNRKEIKLSTDFTIKVYPVTIEENELWVTNWFYLYGKRIALMNNGNPVKPYSPLFWDLVKVIAENAASFGQNMALISPVQLCEYSFDGNKYTIDFSNFDKMVEIFSNAGALKRIEGGHISTNLDGPNTPFGLYVPEIAGDSKSIRTLPLSSEKAQNFYKQFIPALITHLKEKGWYNIYVQHIGDEPMNTTYKSYVEIAKFFKKLAPDIPIIDAIVTKNLDNVVDIYVPVLDELNKDYDYYAGRQIAGDEVWSYVCTGPQGNYANRFIELPLIKPRLLFWINFKYDLKGYLHWGFNAWNDHPFLDGSFADYKFPAGDGAFVYPGFRKLYRSIRFDAQRDGIADFNLLKMLSRKDPEKAKAYCDRMIYSFDSYNTDVLTFRENRRNLLKALSEN